MEFQGQTALVTGGGSGLGAATARELARLGAKVAVMDINGDQAKSVAEEIGGVSVTADITNSDQVSAALDAVEKLQGPARILANVAGIGGAKRLLNRDGSPSSQEDFERVVRVNLFGSYNVTRHAAARMAKLSPLEDGERGVILLTASVAAYEGQVGQAAYSAAKGGLVSMTLPLARDLAQFGIRVATIAPGLFLTPLMQQLPEDIQKSLGESIPFPKRLGKPDEFAKLVAHIIGNVHINGEIIRLDGAVRLAPR